MVRKKYQSDLSDKRWDKIKTFLPPAAPGGRPRKVNLREIVNAIFYLNKAGCAWRDLPGEFPPWETVYGYFRDWRLSGVWKKNERELAEILAKAGRTKKTSLSWDLGLPECEDYFGRRVAGLRWWEESEWPEAPHFS